MSDHLIGGGDWHGFARAGKQAAVLGPFRDDPAWQPWSWCPQRHHANLDDAMGRGVSPKSRSFLAAIQGANRALAPSAAVLLARPAPWQSGELAPWRSAG